MYEKLYDWWHEPINDEPWQVTHGAVVMGHVATAILFCALLVAAVCDALVIYAALYDGGMR